MCVDMGDNILECLNTHTHTHTPTHTEKDKEFSVSKQCYTVFFLLTGIICNSESSPRKKIGGKYGGIALQFLEKINKRVILW